MLVILPIALLPVANAGNVVRLTGWVACQNVPVTGVVGIVAIDTGCVTPEPSTRNPPDRFNDKALLVPVV